MQICCYVIVAKLIYTFSFCLYISHIFNITRKKRREKEKNEKILKNSGKSEKNGALGHYLSYSGCHNALRKDEIMTNIEIISKAEEGKYDRRAASRFIRDMEPFIRSVCSRFCSSERFLPFRDDIFVAAEEGMYKAMLNFDFSKKGFLSYAKKSIEMEVRLFLSNETRTVRLPRYVISAQKLISDYRRENGNGDNCGAMKAAGITSGKTFRLIENARSFDTVSSLDYEINEKGTVLGSLIADGTSVDDEILLSEAESELRRSLLALSESERYIIIHSFGLDGGKRKKNSEMATELDITKATVIARRKRALSLLKTELLPLVT